MKKILFGLVILALLVGVGTVFSDTGYKANVFARWYQLGLEPQTVTFTLPSRDLTIHNGAAIDICVNPKGNATSIGGGTCVSTDGNFQLNGTASITLRDFVTDAIVIASMGASASPVSVIVTY